MRRIKPLLMIFLFVMILLLEACNMPREELTPAEQTAIIQTSVAKTIAAESRKVATPTDTPVSEGEITNTPEGEPTATETPEPTDTPEPDTPTPSDTPIPCNLGKFVSDVTVPDGKVFGPGETFTKTWRLKNVGSCAWTSGYDIVFSGGDAMSAPSSVEVTSGTVNPGQNVDVSVDLVSPTSAGTYRGNWQLRDPSDVIFGIENSSSGYFWVEIEVIVPTDTPDLQSATLHKDPARSANISIGGSSGETRLGIAPNGDPIRAFVDFNLGTLSGLTTTSTVDSATLDLSNFTGNSCFEFLHPLKALHVTYGSTPLYPDDFDSAPHATLLSVPSGAEISSPVDITTAVQDYVDSNGAGHFQIRMELEHDDAGPAFACYMKWPDPLLNITYRP
jgi:hypothetical protein